jgi:transcriptional regulator with XRE-family HTH domain
MRIDEYMADEAVLAELGTRLERTRLERNLTQRELAAQAGVERKALVRMEGGESVRLVSFIRVLRALGLLDVLDRLVPEPTPSPMELLKLHGRQRRRATGRRRRAGHPRVQEGPWRWGDERGDGRGDEARTRGDEAGDAKDEEADAKDEEAEGKDEEAEARGDAAGARSDEAGDKQGEETKDAKDETAAGAA